MGVKKGKFVLAVGVISLFLLATVGIYAHGLEPVWIQIRNYQEMRGLQVTDYERGVFKQCDGCRPASVRFSCNGTEYDFPLHAGSALFANADFPQSENTLQYTASCAAGGAWHRDIATCAPDGFEYEQMGAGDSFTGKDDRTLVHMGFSYFGRNYTIFYFYPIERIPDGSGGYTFRDILQNPSIPS